MSARKAQKKSSVTSQTVTADAAARTTLKCASFTNPAVTITYQATSARLNALRNTFNGAALFVESRRNQASDPGISLSVEVEMASPGRFASQMLRPAAEASKPAGALA